MAPPTLALVGIAVSAVANVLHIVALATKHWMEIDGTVHSFVRVSGNLGLFHEKPLDSTEATAAFAVIGCLIGLASLAGLIVSLLIESLRGNKIVVYGILAAGCAACASILLGCFIFIDLLKEDVNDPGYSYFLAIVGAVGIAVGTVIGFLGIKAPPS